MDKGFEIVDDALIEAVELGSPLGVEPGICFDGAEKTCRERGIDAFEELQEHEGDGIALREELVAARVRELGHQAFGVEFREIVTERGQCVAFGGAAEGLDDSGVDFGGGEGIAGAVIVPVAWILFSFEGGVTRL